MMERLVRAGLVLTVLALAIVQIILTWDFWGTVGAGDDVLTIVFQCLGALLAIIEALALVVAGYAAERGERNRAFIARLLFVPLFLVNLAGDLGAIAGFSASAVVERGRAAALYDENERIAREAEAEIARLRADLEARGLLLPVDALRAQAQSARDRVGRYEAAGTVAPRSVRERATAIESALATASEMERLSAARERALHANAEVGHRPSETLPQFEAIATLLQQSGIAATPEGVRIWLAAGLGLALKLWLSIGLWVSASSVRPSGEPPGEGDDPPGEPSRAPEPPTARSRASSAYDILDELVEESAA